MTKLLAAHLQAYYSADVEEEERITSLDSLRCHLSTDLVRSGFSFPFSFLNLSKQARVKCAFETQQRDTIALTPVGFLIAHLKAYVPNLSTLMNSTQNCINDRRLRHMGHMIWPCNLHSTTSFRYFMKACASISSLSLYGLAFNHKIVEHY